MSRSTSTSRKKKKVQLNGRYHAYDDTTGFNALQLAHRRGEIDLYADIPCDEGEPLPSVAEQWKEDYRKRFIDGKSSRNR